MEVKKSKGLVPFPEALEFMEKRVEGIIAGREKQMIWFLEHEPVYTAGVSAKEEDLLVKSDVPVFKTNRGGQYTYHCPGMLVVYFMLDLKKFFAPNQPDVRKFVEFLENLIIKALAQYDIKGEIKQGRVGIWVEDDKGREKKIAALGIKLRKWVSYHGIAININPNLKGFSNIVPCGIKEFGVTSIEDIYGNVTNDKFVEYLINEL
ncbi:MAG: lipoyl(octanoyl) transferase LipB [Rickettsiales bacterium]|nr:lipoyl(octanoyl) transferase LipB [Rickettsiales bacterium]